MNGSGRLSLNFRSLDSPPIGGASGPRADHGPIRARHWPPHRGQRSDGRDWLRRTFVLAQLAQWVVPSLGDGMVLLLSRHTEPGPGLLSSASPEASRDPSPLRDRSEAVTLSPSVIRMELASGVFDARHADNTEVLLALLTQNKELEGESKSVIGYRCMPVRLQSRRTTKISSTMYLLIVC